MFNNISKKIKSLAVGITCFGMIASFLFGLVAASTSVLLCLAIIFIGFLVSWVGSFALYGFGHLLDITETTAYYAKHSYNKLHNVEDLLERVVQNKDSANSPEVST